MIRRGKIQLNVHVNPTVKAAAILLAERQGTSMAEYIAGLIDDDARKSRPFAIRIR